MVVETEDAVIARPAVVGPRGPRANLTNIAEASGWTGKIGSYGSFECSDASRIVIAYHTRILHDANAPAGQAQPFCLRAHGFSH